MKVYLLEDETNILKHLITLIQEIPYLKIVGYSTTVAQARREIRELEPELILADIKLKDGSSFEVFRDMDLTVPIIFITAYEQFAVDALNLGAFAYLLKPVDETIFKNSIDRCFLKAEEYRFTRQQLQLSAGYFTDRNPPLRLALKSTAHTQIVNTHDIIYCHSDKGYTTFYIKGENPLMVSKVIREYEFLLPPGQFLRCHQSYLVNVDCIRKYFQEGYIELIDGTLIPVSARKKILVREFLHKIG